MSAVFEPGTEENHLALEQLRELMINLGFEVSRKSRKEATLRAYIQKLKQHPLLNPRFVKSEESHNLEITVLSKDPDASLGSALMAQNTSKCTFIPLNEHAGALHLHGFLFCR